MFWFLDDLLGDALAWCVSLRFLGWLVLVVLGMVGIHHLPGPLGLHIGLDVVWFVSTPCRSLTRGPRRRQSRRRLHVSAR